MGLVSTSSTFAGVVPMRQIMLRLNSSYIRLCCRISVVFRVRSAQRIKISDTDLIKRLALIVLIFSAFLTVRMVIGRPRLVGGE